MLSEDWIDECCVEKYVGMREKILEEMEITAAGLRTVRELPLTIIKLYLIFMTKEAEEDFGTGKFSRHQKFLWDLVEHSESSTMAQIVSIMSMSFVGVSIVGMIVNTLEATQYTVKLPPNCHPDSSRFIFECFRI